MAFFFPIKRPNSTHNLYSVSIKKNHNISDQMNKICTSSCVDDARSPVRATYVNLYKWPESDAEFVKSTAVHGDARLHSRVDSITCRQMYLRSYTFSREETLLEKTLKCLGKVREMMAAATRETKWGSLLIREFRRRLVMMDVKDLSAAAFRAIIRRLLSCTSSMRMKELDF